MFNLLFVCECKDKLKILIEQEKMRKFSVLKEKIFQYLEYKNITKSEFYRNTGVANGTLSQISELGGENLVKILSFYRDLSADWLFRNEGQMIRTNSENTSVANVANNQDDNKESMISYIQSLERTIEAQQETIRVQKELLLSFSDTIMKLENEKIKAGMNPAPTNEKK